MRLLHVAASIRRVLVVLAVAIFVCVIKSLPHVIENSVLETPDQGKLLHRESRSLESRPRDVNSLDINSFTDNQHKLSPFDSDSDQSQAWILLQDILSNGGYPVTSLDYILTSLRSGLPKPQVNVPNLPNNSYFLVQPKINANMFSHDTLLVFVQSSPERVAERQRIRETWGSITNYPHTRYKIPIHVIFAMGVPADIYSPGLSSSMDGVLLEDSLADDILLLNILDTYNSLAYKGLLTMLWAANKSPRIKYIFKTDDDVLLNTYAWLGLIRTLERHSITCSVVGHVWQKPEVVRQGKYKEMLGEYEYDLYPSFCSGAGYLIPRDSLRNILEASFHLPILKRDDPFYTGIIPRQTGIHLLSIPWSSYAWSSTGLSWGDDRNLTFFAHAPSASDWHAAWRNFRIDHKLGHKYYVLLDDRTDRNTSIPPKWVLPAPKTLKQSCIPKRTFKSFRVKL